jgi:hypothetical protein
MYLACGDFAIDPAKNQSLVFDQMAAPVPEVMDSSFYVSSQLLFMLIEKLF